MNIIFAETLGFCGGVKRAVDLVYKETDKTEGSNILMEGPIIHNNSIIKDLNQKGVTLLNDIKNINGKKVVIRAHGITPQLEENIMKNGGELIDGTCPIVKKSQKKIIEYRDKGYFIVICGDKGHAEVVGLKGYAPENSIVIGHIEDLVGLKIPDNTVLISQTTFSKPEFFKIEETLKERCPSLVVLNTICNATKKRQDAVIQLAKEVDAIIVIGGVNSSNTQRLKRAVESHVPTWLVEDETELPLEIYNYKNVGITAGASTPQFVIDKVVQTLESY